MLNLIAPHMERCIGCLLCVLASAREQGNLSLTESAIRITREEGSFVAHTDPGLSVSVAVVKVCPRNCLSLSGGVNG